MVTANTNKAHHIALALYHALLEDLEKGDEFPLTCPSTAGYLAQCVSMTPKEPYLEIGSRYGGSAVLASQFGQGDIYCIDPMQSIHHDGPEVVDYFWKNMDKFGIRDRVRLFQAKSDPFPLEDQLVFPLQQWGDDAPVSLRFGTTFIDGDHSYPWPGTDWRNVKDITNHFVVFDNVEMDDVYETVMQATQDPLWMLAHLNAYTAVMVRKTTADKPGVLRGLGLLT